MRDLTPREIEILRLIARGQTNREIGAALAISEGTVKGHLQRVFHKMGVDDRTQAAILALERGPSGSDRDPPKVIDNPRTFARCRKTCPGRTFPHVRSPGRHTRPGAGGEK